MSVTLGDGAPVLWQGGGPGSAHASRRRSRRPACARPRRDDARDWGYQRLEAASSRAGHGCGAAAGRRDDPGRLRLDARLRISEGDQRLIVNCGGAPGLPAELAAGLSTTAAHSTLALADTNSTALHEDGSLGRGVAEVEMERSEGRDGATLEAAHDGYVRRHGFAPRTHA
jgi:uncharacterized heparinase superfamily protein